MLEFLGAAPARIPTVPLDLAALFALALLLLHDPLLALSVSVCLEPTDGLVLRYALRQHAVTLASHLNFLVRFIGLLTLFLR